MKRKSRIFWWVVAISSSAAAIALSGGLIDSKKHAAGGEVGTLRKFQSSGDMDTQLQQGQGSRADAHERPLVADGAHQPESGVADPQGEKVREFISQQGAGVSFVRIQDLPEGARMRMLEKAKALQAHTVFDVDHQIPSLGEIMASGSEGFVKPETLYKPGFIQFELIDPASTGLDGAVLVSAAPAGSALTQGSGIPNWTGATRLFKDHPRFGNIALSEENLGVAGRKVIIPQENINARVNGNPAVIASQRNSEGQTRTTLVWYANEMSYELTIQQIDPESRKDLISLAETISGSTSPSGSR